MTLDEAETAEALHAGQVARRVTREIVIVDGPDAASYLQGQVTQDIDPLEVGGATEALVLSPAGKVDAYVRVIRFAEERFGVEVDSGFGEVLLERLRRFKIRIKATLELTESHAVEIRGPKAVAPTEVGPGVVVIGYAFGGFVGYDLVGTDVEVPEGIALGDEGAFERARIIAGVPRMGRELTDKTIPQEAGIVERTVSFSKGCYTGQELVARLDARGNRVPWNLRALVAPVELGADEEIALFSKGAEVGRLTSANYSSAEHTTVALGYLKRDFAVPGEAEVHLDSGPVTIDVHALIA